MIFAGGFRPGYESWVHCPGAFDEMGFPLHDEGASTVADGLYFVGVHFLRKRKSSLLVGVGEDAAIVAAADRRALGRDRGAGGQLEAGRDLVEDAEHRARSPASGSGPRAWPRRSGAPAPAGRASGSRCPRARS